MFGMLDYRAHKLFRLLFFIPRCVAWLISIFAYPVVSCLIAFELVKTPVWQFALAIGVFFVLGIVWSLVVWIYSALEYAFFSFVIDVVPTNGRTEAEAKAVVLGGKAISDLQEYEKTLRAPDHALIERIATRGLFAPFFSGDVRLRLETVSEYYADHPAEVPSEGKIRQVLKDNGLSMPLHELILTNPIYRAYVLQLAVFVVALWYRIAQSTA